MPKVIIDKKVFNIKNMTDQRLQYLIERTGVRREVPRGRNTLEIKELSGVDPYTIAIGIGAAIVWIVYRVSQSQKEEFRNNFGGSLR